MATARLPRFKRRPDAVPAGFRLTERDEAIIRLVGRLRYARSQHLIALIQATWPGASGDKLLRRLRTLYDLGFLGRPHAQVDPYRAGAGSQPMVYTLGRHGVDLAAEKYGMRRSAVDRTEHTAVRDQVTHAIGITDFMVGLELACRRRGNLAVIWFDEILSTIAPPAMRQNPRPYHWPVAVRDFDGKPTELYVIPDKIFGIRDLERQGRGDRKFFMLEVDTGSMPVERTTLGQTSLARKLIGYAHTYRADLHASLYGLPNMRVLLVTTGDKRIDNIIAAHRRHTAALVSPRLFLLAERPGLIAAEDVLAYEWRDAEGGRRRLLD